jgi:co-chaperonin GroES (HSP10)
MSDTEVNLELANKFTPLYDNVILEQIIEKAKGGIELPKVAQEKVLVRCRVLAVGPGKLDATTKQHVPMSLKRGDIVHVNSYLGMKLKADARTELIIQKEEEIRVVEKAA